MYVLFARLNKKRKRSRAKKKGGRRVSKGCDSVSFIVLLRLKPNILDFWPSNASSSRVSTSRAYHHKFSARIISNGFFHKSLPAIYYKRITASSVMALFTPGVLSISFSRGRKEPRKIHPRAPPSFQRGFLFAPPSRASSEPRHNRGWIPQRQIRERIYAG